MLSFGQHSQLSPVRYYDELKNAKKFLFPLFVCSDEQYDQWHRLGTAGSGNWSISFLKIGDRKTFAIHAVMDHEAAMPKNAYEAKVCLKLLDWKKEKTCYEIRKHLLNAAVEWKVGYVEYDLLPKETVGTGCLFFELQVLVEAIVFRGTNLRMPNIYDPTDTSLACVDKDGNELYVDKQLFAAHSSVVAELVKNGADSTELFRESSYETMKYFIHVIHGIRQKASAIVVYDTAMLASCLKASSVLRHCEDVILRTDYSDELIKGTELWKEDGDVLLFHLARCCGFRRYMKMFVEKKMRSRAEIKRWLEEWLVNGGKKCGIEKMTDESLRALISRALSFES